MEAMLRPSDTELSEDKPMKAAVPMDTTESGIVTELSDEQPMKAKPPMETTESPIVTELSDEQSLKAPPSMVTTTPESSPSSETSTRRRLRCRW